MILRNELVFVIVVLFVRKLQAKYPTSPCPDIFKYDRSGGEDIGILTINNLALGDNLVEIKLTQAGTIESDYIGAFELNPEYNNTKKIISEGSSVTYTVKFAIENVIPVVRYVRLNGIKICSGRKIPTPSTNVFWEHTVDATEPPKRRAQKTTTSPQNDLPSYLQYGIDTSNDYSNNAYGPKRTTRATTTPRPTTTTRSSSTSTTTTNPPVVDSRVNFIQRPNQWTHINSVCGKENFDHTFKHLVVGGEKVPPARFPWIVALFQKNLGSVSFQCGGSLITTRTVVSAAHCFYTKNNVIIKDEDMFVSIGGHYINDWIDSEHAVNIGVEKTIIHPDYITVFDHNDADLAIVRLKKPVEFTYYIRPVCMWEGPLDVNDIEGISGIVVGWGLNENNSLNKVPTLARASVTSEINCIHSNTKFFHHTSNRTLCAGNRDGSGPCSGDSGSGFMIQVRNKWMLRGVVSLSLTSETEIHGCDLKNYVVYGDVAQFLGWIYANSVF